MIFKRRQVGADHPGTRRSRFLVAESPVIELALALAVRPNEALADQDPHLAVLDDDVSPRCGQQFADPGTHRQHEFPAVPPVADELVLGVGRTRMKAVFRVW
ncbi:hypothetical protein [Amycolatopsis jejuensis]|uniref:hypothetical protein n=1 Tax=Amycolatopsis jejuensis TaxID=330084 RepID=UPI0012E02BDE|nr:hypothetical protein [Amycolatopsis jejuensis]